MSEDRWAKVEPIREAYKDLMALEREPTLEELEAFAEISVASESPNVDLSLARYLFRADVERFFLLVSVLLVGAAIGLSFWIWRVSIFPLLLAFVLTGASWKGALQAKAKFHAGMLNAAVVTSVEPIEFLAFANMSQGRHTSIDGYQNYCGVRLMSTVSLAPHEIKVGEVIPCASFFTAGASDTHWVDFDPTPLCFGTDDKLILRS